MSANTITIARAFIVVYSFAKSPSAVTGRLATPDAKPCRPGEECFDVSLYGRWFKLGSHEQAIACYLSTR